MMLKAVLLVSLCGLVVTEAYTAKRKADTDSLSSSPVKRELLKLANILKQRELDDAKSQTKRIAKNQSNGKGPKEGSKDGPKDDDDESDDLGEDFDGGPRVLGKLLDKVESVVNAQDLILKYQKNKDALAEIAADFDLIQAIGKVVNKFEAIKNAVAEKGEEEEEEEEEEEDDEETE